MNLAFLYRGIVFEADKGGGGGEPPSPSTPAQGEQSQAASSAATQNTEAQPSEHMIPKSRFDEVNNELKRLKAEAATKQQQEQEAEQARLKEQQKWQQLAEQHERQLTELKPQLEAATQQAERYKAAVEAQVKAQLANVPEHLHGLLAKLDPVEQLEWLAANADKLKPAVRGIPPTPRPDGGPGQDMATLQAQQQATVQRSF